MYRLEDGSFVQVADLTEEQTGMSRSDQGGWSQANYQRHFDDIAEKHMKDVAEELNRRVRERRVPVVVVGPEEIRAEFEDALAQETHAALLGWAAVESHATPAKVLEVISPLLEEAESAEEAELLERWQELAGRGGRATGGWPETLEALSDGRVDVLLVASGRSRTVWQCPACGRAAAVAGRLPARRDPDGRRATTASTSRCTGALAHGSRVHLVRHHDDLGPADGIGALLRF